MMPANFDTPPCSSAATISRQVIVVCHAPSNGSLASVALTGSSFVLLSTVVEDALSESQLARVNVMMIPTT